MGVITFEDEELKRFLKEGTVERKIGTKKITVGSIVSVVRKNGYRTVAKARVINIGEGKAIFEIVTGSVKKNIFSEPVLQ
ncbi:MAG: hypothetical protein QXP04_02415, partial [Candidatus Nanoarchaeia archaeon]|nr:hypothetical protein [Candidatus Jingweiarchaeum tengchongense]